MSEVPEKVKKLIKKATYRSMWWHDFLTNVFLPIMTVVNITFGAFVLFGGLSAVYNALGYVKIDLSTSIGVETMELYRLYDVVFGVLTIISGVCAIFVRREMQAKTKKSVGLLMVLIEIPSLVWMVYFRIIQQYTSDIVNTAVFGLSTIAFALIMFIINYIYYDRRTKYFQNKL